MRSSRSCSILVLVATVLVSVSAQYGHYRPYPMSMPASGFSPYHPARINHETLPISQAEFAQLVAESMATSNGPHHHHPPNTDADYEGADHYRSYHNGGGRRQSHGQHSHHQPSSSYQQYHQQEQYEPQEQNHGVDNGYQPDENEHEYPRQAVYEKDGVGSTDANEEDDEVENNSYGGRPGAYEEGYDEATGQGNQEVDNAVHHQPGGEQGPGQDQYMAASAPMVQRYRYVVDTHK